MRPAPSLDPPLVIRVVSFPDGVQKLKKSIINRGYSREGSVDAVIRPEGPNYINLQRSKNLKTWSTKFVL